MSQIFFDKDREDIVETLENGVYAGSSIVSGSVWDGPIISTNIQCLCTSNTVAGDVAIVKDHMASSLSSLDTIVGYFSITVSALPSSVQDDLTANGRAHTEESELLAAIRWTDGWDENTYRTLVLGL